MTSFSVGAMGREAVLKMPILTYDRQASKKQNPMVLFLSFLFLELVKASGDRHVFPMMKVFTDRVIKHCPNWSRLP
jgi:hypothetical protein